MSAMTPQQIFEYKSGWQCIGYRAYVNQDLYRQGVEFCKENFQKHRWSVDKFSRPDDAHLFKFEREEDYQTFSEQFDLLDDWHDVWP